MHNAQIVTDKINSQINHFFYELEIDMDFDTIVSLSDDIQTAMGKALSEMDCWKIALSCADMWGNISQMFCDAIKSAYCIYVHQEYRKLFENNNKTFFSKEQAKHLAKTLNNDPDDNWSYVVDYTPKYGVILIYGPDNEFIGFL